MNIRIIGKKFSETKLPEKEEFYSNLNVEEIPGVDSMHGKRVCKDFDIKKIGEYHDLYLKSDTSLLAGVFENIRKMYLKVRELYKISFGYLISMPSNF